MSKTWATVTLDELAWPNDGTWPEFIIVGMGDGKESCGFYVPTRESDRQGYEALKEENAKLRDLVRELLHVNAYECGRCKRTTNFQLKPPYPKCGADCQLLMDAGKLGVEWW